MAMIGLQQAFSSKGNTRATHHYASALQPCVPMYGLLQDNILHGRFLAELTKEVLTDLELSKYQHAEYRISIYGRKQVEWDILAAWYCQNKLYSDNVLWLIQVHHHCNSPRKHAPPQQ